MHSPTFVSGGRSFPGRPPGLQARSRPGVAFVWVLLVLGVVAILVGILAVRSRQHITLAAWYSDRVGIRLLADSAAEELSVALQRHASDRGSSVREALASGAAGTVIRGVEPQRVLTEVSAWRGSSISRLTLETEVTVLSRERVSYDEREVAGTLRIVARIRSSGPGRSFEELSWLVREFRVGCASFPSQTFPVQVLVAEPDRESFPEASGQAICAGEDASPRSVLDLMTKPAPDGFRLMDQESAGAITGYFRTDVMRRRAFLIFKSGASFHEYHASRVARGLPLDGIYHIESDEPVGISLEGFRGRAQVSSRGPIIAGEIRMARPLEDQLVLASAGRIVVQGRTVQASLVALTGEGVQLAWPAHIEGRLLSRTFPAAMAMTLQELSDVRISLPGNAPVETGPGDLQIVLDPSPLRLLHREPAAVVTAES